MAPPARAEAIPQAIAPTIITSLKWLETNNLFNNLIQRNQSAAFSSGKVRPNHETNINIIARRTGKDVNSHTVLDGIITTIMATIQRINIIGSREGSRNRRRLKANQTGKKFRVGIKSNISTNRNNLISGVDRCIHLNAMKKTTITSINRQDRKSGSAGMPRPISYAVFCLKKKKKKKTTTTQYYTYYHSLFFFKNTSPTDTYTLSLHDALPI